MTTTLSPGIPTRYILQPGESLALVTDSASSCTYGQLAYPGVVPDVATMIAVGSSTTVVIGPRSDTSRWIVDGVTGTSVTIAKTAAASVPDVGNPADVMHIYGSGAPSSPATGQNNASTGSLYTDVSAGKLYVNSGSKGSPSWRLVTSA